MRIKLKSTTIITIIIMLTFLFCGNSFALEYQTKAGVNFTLLPSISVSLSSADLIINDLVPGNSQDSNEIIINVESNNSTGYVLNSSVGSSTNPYSTYGRNLTNTASSSYTFTSLNYGDSKESLTDPNTWGYSYSDQTVATPTWSSYSGLPLYSDTTNIATLKSSNTTSLETGDSIKFKIAAYASNTQGSGEYTNIINFIAVGNPTPTSFYDAFATAASQPGSTITQLNGYYKMQDMTADICDAVDLYDDNSHIQLIDTRDNEVYWIGKLKDNRCWLLDNLRLGSNDHEIPLTPEDTNIAEAWTLPRGVTSNFNSYTEAKINAAYKNDTNVTSYGTASGKVGTYYNYCATSAGTYCYPSDAGVGDAKYDICPTEWRMPNEIHSNEYRLLYSAYSNNFSKFKNAFSASLAGLYDGVSVYGKDEYGYYSSSTSSSVDGMYGVGISDNALTYMGHRRTGGLPIRCIANNE